MFDYASHALFEGRPITIELSFEMLSKEGAIPRQSAYSYVDVMANVAHIVQP